MDGVNKIFQWSEYMGTFIFKLHFRDIKCVGVRKYEKRLSVRSYNTFFLSGKGVIRKIGPITTLI